jgi:hypothetical protein
MHKNLKEANNQKESRKSNNRENVQMKKKQEQQ